MQLSSNISLMHILWFCIKKSIGSDTLRYSVCNTVECKILIQGCEHFTQHITKIHSVYKENKVTYRMLTIVVNSWNALSTFKIVHTIKSWKSLITIGLNSHLCFTTGEEPRLLFLKHVHSISYSVWAYIECG